MVRFHAILDPILDASEEMTFWPLRVLLLLEGKVNHRIPARTIEKLKQDIVAILSTCNGSN
jgi:hypothetical protein